MDGSRRGDFHFQSMGWGLRSPPCPGPWPVRTTMWTPSGPCAAASGCRAAWPGQRSSPFPPVTHMADLMQCVTDYRLRSVLVTCMMRISHSFPLSVAYNLTPHGRRGARRFAPASGLCSSLCGALPSARVSATPPRSGLLPGIFLVPRGPCVSIPTTNTVHCSITF